MIEIFVTAVGVTILIFGIVLSELVEFELKIVILSLSTVTFLLSIITAAYLDYKNGKYQCKNCGKTFKPTVWQYTISPHIGNARNLRCPGCNEKNWCKRVKDED